MTGGKGRGQHQTGYPETPTATATEPSGGGEQLEQSAAPVRGRGISMLVARMLLEAWHCGRRGSITQPSAPVGPCPPGARPADISQVQSDNFHEHHSTQLSRAHGRGISLLTGGAWGSWGCMATEVWSVPTEWELDQGGPFRKGSEE